MKRVGAKPEIITLSPRFRIRAAFGLAVVADALQLAILPMFVEGAASPADDALDMGVGAAMVFLLGFHGKDLDVNYSARPLAREMQQQAPDVKPVAVENVRRDMVYGLAFYRNEEPIDYGKDGVPDAAHLLVIPASQSAQLERWLAGRVYEPLFLYPSQGLEVYKVYAK